jgi:hypothetical protein
MKSCGVGEMQRVEWQTEREELPLQGVLGV